MLTPGRLAVASAACLGSLTLAHPALAQQTVQRTLTLSATFAERVKVDFDRTTVVLDTEAFDPDTVTGIAATPLTVTAKARIIGNARVVMTVQADGPLRSGADLIPINKLTWRATGAGFMTTGTANAQAARTLASWRGSGTWTGSQTYLFADSWTYPVGTYTAVMTYTLAVP